jgi:hypothetical protein
MFEMFTLNFEEFLYFKGEDRLKEILFIQKDIPTI